MKAKASFTITPGSEQVRKTIQRDGYVDDFEKLGAKTSRGISVTSNIMFLERIFNEIFKDEVSFYSHYKNDTIVENNYLKKYPEKNKAPAP